MASRRIVPNFQHLFRQLEDNVGSMLSRLPTSMISPTSSLEGPTWLLSSPIADIHETEKSYIIEAELPGLKKEDVSMELVNDNTLSLKGSFKSEKEDKGKTFWSKERMTGEFRRAFTFPNAIDPEKIKASMENGILKVEIEKAGESHKKLPIKID